ncbi:MAG: hypothetical protein ACYDBV_12055 [Nitrospiria bacterium]
MASLRYKVGSFIDETAFVDSFNESGLKEWNRSNEDLLRDFGKALYDIILLNSVEQDGFITWN